MPIVSAVNRIADVSEVTLASSASTGLVWPDMEPMDGRGFPSRHPARFLDSKASDCGIKSGNKPFGPKSDDLVRAA